MRQAVKFDVLERILPVLEGMRRQRREFILCGDWNIAHQQIDLKNWRSNQKNSGFLPEERAWLSDLFQRVGFVDAFRVVNQAPDQYTWWSIAGRAWDKTSDGGLIIRLSRQVFATELRKLRYIKKDAVLGSRAAYHGLRLGFVTRRGGRNSA